MRTRTSRPRSSSMSPSKKTSRFVGVRPTTCSGRLTLRSSTSTSSVRPRKRCERSSACSPTSRLMIWSRASLTSSGSWSLHVAIGVLGRGEYAAVIAASNLTVRISSRVRSNCASVSPGIPTMKSEVMAASGIALRMRSTIWRYLSAVYPRPILLSTSSSPDCAGMWNTGMSFGCSATTLTTESLMYLGCEVTKRTRSMPGTSATYASRSAKRRFGLMSRPYASMFCPSRVTSL
mmetsp:Transcript_3543/g.9174  ORF Transcript_3543/g.9174 Transcript_3543/m.9174 type:complete len:234 (+) Transcript_3543:793-1494(+)